MSDERATRPTAPSDDELRALQADVFASSYLRGDFVLGSLGPTHVYFDKYLFLTQPSILRRLATAVGRLVEPGTDRIACAELGGVALAAAISLELGLPFVILRREAREGEDVEGELAPGDRIVLVEDVVATGRHALTYLERLRAHGATVDHVVAVLDRREGARDALEAADCRLRALFEWTDGADAGRLG